MSTKQNMSYPNDRILQGCVKAKHTLHICCSVGNPWKDMVSGRNQSQKTMLCMIQLIETFPVGQITRDIRSVVTQWAVYGETCFMLWLAANHWIVHFKWAICMNHILSKSLWKKQSSELYRSHMTNSRAFINLSGMSSCWRQSFMLIFGTKWGEPITWSSKKKPHTFFEWMHLFSTDNIFNPG